MIAPSTPSSAAGVGGAAVQAPGSGARAAASAKASTSAPGAAGAIEAALRMLVDGGAIPPGLAPARSSSATRRRASTRSSSAGYARNAGTKTTSSKSDPLAFLRDPKLSVEEKLMRLLSYLNEKWEKEMQQKLDQIAAGEAGTTSKTTGKSSGKKKGGLLGGIIPTVANFLSLGGIASEALKIPLVRSAVAKLGGPVLAAAAGALGFPSIAPALLRYGPAIVEAAAGAASALEKVSVGTTASAGGAKASSGGTKKMSDAERQQILMEIQRLQEKQKEMFGLVSNVLRMNHDSRMAVIGNLR